MKLKLYDIAQEYMILAEQLIDNGGELTPELETALAINEENLTTKGTNYGLVIKDLESDVDQIDAEIARLTALKNSRNKSVDRLKEMLSKAMELYGMEKIESPILKISFRKSKSVEIVNEAQLDSKFITVKTTLSPNKVKIGKALKAGETVEGAVLKENKNIQVK